MIPSTADRTVTGNLQGTKIAMGFDAAAMNHIMSVLTDLYSDPEAAIIREYSTNAADSHAEARQSRPIEVYTPGPLSPYFRVRDYGTGMSVDDIHAIYSKYGASTKRESNEAVGMLGLGCKSALAYAAQFTLVAVKNGTRATVAISRDESGAGTMTVVDTAATSEPSGVEVVIPARSQNRIAEKARAFFAYWPAGTVLIDAEAPPATDVTLQVTPTIAVTLDKSATGERPRSVVVMGNVAYPAPDLDAHRLGIPYRSALVARVPIGAVDFTPSREALQMTRRTQAALEAIKAEFRAALPGAVQARVDEAQSRPEAAQVVRKWSSLAGTCSGFAYRGRALPDAIKAKTRMLTSSAGTYRLGHASEVPSWPLSQCSESAIFVTGFVGGMTPTTKKKLNQWAAKAGLEAKSYVLMDDFEQGHRIWVEPRLVVDFATVRAEKLPRSVRSATGRLPGSYDVLVRAKDEHRGRVATGVAGDAIDRAEAVFYMEGSKWSSTVYQDVLDANLAAYTVICLPGNRVAKFTRENPEIEPVRSYVEARFKAWAATLSDDDKEALWFHDEGRYTGRTLGYLKAHEYRLKDPKLRRAVRLASTDLPNTHVSTRLAYGAVGLRLDLSGVSVASPLEKYPLFDTTNMVRHPEHTIAYLNHFA